MNSYHWFSPSNTYFYGSQTFNTLFYKKGNLSPRFYRAQRQLTKFSKIKIIHTPGKKLPAADMLSRSFTKAELQLNQLKHKQLPPQISFGKLFFSQQSKVDTYYPTKMCFRNKCSNELTIYYTLSTNYTFL